MDIKSQHNKIKQALIHADSTTIIFKIDDALVIYCESKYAIQSLNSYADIDWIDIWLEHLARSPKSVPKLAQR